MPSGTGKTVSLLSLIVSYQQASPPALSLSRARPASHPPPVLPRKAQAGLLLPHRPRDRKGPLRAQAPHGVPRRRRRVRRRPQEGAGLHRHRPHQPQEPLHTPRGASLPPLRPPRPSDRPRGRSPRRKRARSSTRAAAISRTPPSASGRGTTRAPSRHVAFTTCVLPSSRSSVWVARRPERAPLQNLGDMEAGQLIPPGIWTLADVLQNGRDKGVCPYFTVRRMVRPPTPALALSLRPIACLRRCRSSTS